MACVLILSGPSRLLSAAVILIHSGPSAPFGFLFRDAAIFITFFDMFSFALLLGGILAFVTSRHSVLLIIRQSTCVSSGGSTGRLRSRFDG
jgi:hypothetical protein